MNQDHEQPEADEPLAPLAELEQEVSPHFLGLLRKKISRRTTANQVVAFSWNLPKVIFLELLALIAHWVQGSGKGSA